MDNYQPGGPAFADRFYDLLVTIPDREGRLEPQSAAINLGAGLALITATNFKSLNLKTKFVLGVLAYRRGLITGLAIANKQLAQFNPNQIKSIQPTLKALELNTAAQVTAFLTAVAEPSPDNLRLYRSQDDFYEDIFAHIAKALSNTAAPLPVSTANDRLIQLLQEHCDSGIVKIVGLKINLLTILSDYYARSISSLPPAVAIARSDILLKNQREVCNHVDMLISRVEYLYFAKEQYERKKLHDPDFSEQLQRAFLDHLLPYISEIDRRLDAELDAQQVDICKLAIYIADIMLVKIEFSPVPIAKALAEKYIRIAQANLTPEFVVDLAELLVVDELPGVVNYNQAAELFSSQEDHLNNYKQILKYGMSLVLCEPSQANRALALFEKNASRYPILFFILGELYADGFKGVEVNKIAAKACYEQAVAQKVYPACVGLAVELMSEYQKELAPETQVRVMELLNIAYKANLGDAAVFLGEIYLFGRFDYPQDIEQAKFYLGEAYRLNKNMYALAMKTVIEEHDYAGEPTMTANQRLQFFQILMAEDPRKLNSSVIFQYSIFMFCIEDYKQAFTSLNSSVEYNNTYALYFTAALQFLASKELLNIEPEYLQQIMQTDRQHLLSGPIPNMEMIGPLLSAIQIFKHYLDLGYQINAEYISKVMTRLFSDQLDLAQIETEVRQEFIPELKRKTLELAYNSRTGSANQECADFTASLLGNRGSASTRLGRKIQKTQQAGNVSMAEFNNIMSRFIRIKGGSLRSGSGSRRAAALGAGPDRSLVHMHAPYGGARQPLEAGRAASAAAAMNAMAVALQRSGSKAEGLRKKV